MAHAPNPEPLFELLSGKKAVWGWVAPNEVPDQSTIGRCLTFVGGALSGLVL